MHRLCLLLIDVAGGSQVVAAAELQPLLGLVPREGVWQLRAARVTIFLCGALRTARKVVHCPGIVFISCECESVPIQLVVIFPVNGRLAFLNVHLKICMV